MEPYLDFYAERTGPGLWAEPVNLLTNAAFLVAAWFAWQLVAPHRDRGGMLLVILIALIGIGSALFHSFATRWALLCDVVPIVLYQLTYLVVYIRRVRSGPAWESVVAISLFMGMSWLAGQFPLPAFSLYLPGLAFLVVIALDARARHHPKSHLWLAAAILFALSLTFRTLDPYVEFVFQTGSHFLWHLCNAGVLYLTVRALFLSGERQ
jgi:hypothetical protein